MTDESLHAQESLRNHYVEHMSELQRMIAEPQKQLQQLRQDAQTDGLNVDALNLLIQVRSRNLPDGGSRILTDLISYALSVGIQVDGASSPDLTFEQDEVLTDTTSLHEDSVVSTSRPSLGRYLSFPVQITIGIILAAAMLWYLH